LQGLRHAAGKTIQVLYLEGHTATGTLVQASRDGSVTLADVKYELAGDTSAVTLASVTIVPDLIAGVVMAGGDDVLRLVREADEASGRTMRPSAAAAVSFSASIRNDTGRGAASVGVRALERSMAESASKREHASAQPDPTAEQVLHRPRLAEDVR
jgi:hypothetical protein